MVSGKSWFITDIVWCGWCGRNPATGVDEGGDPECGPCHRLAGGTDQDVPRLSALFASMLHPSPSDVSESTGIPLDVLYARIEAFGTIDGPTAESVALPELLTLGDRTLTIQQWSRVRRIPVPTIRRRIRAGLPIGRVLARITPEQIKNKEMANEDLHSGSIRTEGKGKRISPGIEEDRQGYNIWLARIAGNGRRKSVTA